MFKYFAGPQQDMAALSKGDAPCTLCGAAGPSFRLHYAICHELSSEEKKSATGCFACLSNGRFEFWHNTEIGLLDQNGLTQLYDDHQPPSPSFPAHALAELRRTPRIVTWQQEIWLVHCNDFTVYLGTWQPQDFYHNAADGDGRMLFLEMTAEGQQDLWDRSLRPDAPMLQNWRATYYAFRCLHCCKLRGNWDFD